MTNGMPLVITAAMKPIPTLMNPLKTVNIDTLEPHDASRERSDVCAVPAAAVVAEGEVAFVLANAYLEAFGCTCMADLKAAIAQYADRLDRMGR
jgi:chorismate synthase